MLQHSYNDSLIFLVFIYLEVELTRLRDTAVMHQILRQMAVPNDQHDCKTGWGMISPYKLLSHSGAELFKKVIQDCIHEDKCKPYFWAGKNF